MVTSYLSSTSRYKKKSEEEKEKLRIRMAENYYKKTEGKVKRRKNPLRFVKNSNFKSRNPNTKKE